MRDFVLGVDLRPNQLELPIVIPRKIKRKGQGDGSVYQFKIDAYSPETMPMGRLAQYMAELASLLGEKDAVHFRRLIKGSTTLCANIDREAVPKVRDRVAIVRAGEGNGELIRAFRGLNRLLRDDNAVGILRNNAAGGIVVRFPGRELAEEKFESIRQQGFVDGIVTGIRGKDEAIHITMQSEGQQVSGCETNRIIAKQLGAKLFEPVRLFGRGRWSRDADGAWSLLHFRIESFDALDDAPLSTALTGLREIATDWSDAAYGELTEMRRGPRGKKNGGH